MSELIDLLAEIARTANDRLSGLDLDPDRDFDLQGLDSLDQVQIVMAVEQAFDLQIEDVDYDQCTSLSKIAAYLQRREGG
jgi:acyl carrier protein